ncbi:MAG: FAD-binding oxidoreductase [bacterium]|nr:FAD-binding oxidoreductase [bacterium]
MNRPNEENVFWYSLKKPAQAKKLSGTINADVVVIGGGMAGLSCAQKLREHNLSVVLLEKDFCGAGASGKTSGFITPDSEIELSALLANHGPEKAKRIWEFVIAGVSAIRKNIEDYNIDCDYQVQDSLFIANNKTGLKYVKEQYEARKELGYESTLYSKDGLPEIIGSMGYVGAVRYPDTFGMNSYLYCQAMREILIKNGVQIFEETPAVNITNSSVITPEGRVEAKHVIVAGDRFIPDMGVLKKEIYHVQTFLGISKPLSDENAKKIFKSDKMMAWDTDLIYNYFRVTGNNRVLLGGGDLLYTYAHSISNNTKRFKKRLSSYFHKKFPDVPFELEYIWPGMLGVSKDLLPVMGYGPDNKTSNIWYLGAATGLPWANALGHYAADKIISGRNELDGDFSWKRKFIIGPKIQTLISTPVTYAISHGIAEHL